MNHGFGPGGGGIAHVFLAIGGFVVWLIALAVIVGILVLLVRFLLVATRAAKLYVATHEPAKPVAHTPAPATTSPAVVSDPVSEPLAKPAAKPRTPRPKPPVE